MKPITAKEIIEATGAVQLVPENPTANAVAIDSREVRKGTLFVALPGERVDGHDYVKSALEKGAAVVLLSKKPELDVLTYAIENHRTLLKVENTEQALMDLAEWYLAQFDVLRVAVTGSVGKTSTKEMIGRILETHYNLVKTEGNFNNNIGLPLTVFRVDDSTEAVLLEMGMDKPGEIHGLAKIGRPDIAAITIIGTSHMERLGSREGICEEKCSITDFMNASSTLVVNDDCDLLHERVYTKAKETGEEYHLVRVGQNGENVRIRNAEDHGEEGISFDLSAADEGEAVHFVLPLPGKHQAMNAALAVAVGLAAGVSMEESQKALGSMTETTGNRLKFEHFGSYTVLNDTYNASPESMKAAIDTLALLSKEGTRTVAILGDMFELGTQEKELHGMVGNYAGRMGIDYLIAIGKNAKYFAGEYVQMKPASDENPVHCKYFETKEEAIEALPELIQEGDAILIKASHGMHLEEVTSAIQALAGIR